MRVRRSLIEADLNLGLNRFVWHDYPQQLERLGLNVSIAAMLVADLAERTQWWRRY